MYPHQRLIIKPFRSYFKWLLDVQYKARMPSDNYVITISSVQGRPCFLHYKVKDILLLDSPPSKKKSPVSGCLSPARWLFSLHYETMFNCSQNCWIDRNSAMLCFKWLFYIGVWTFARFVRALLATVYGKFGVPVSRISLLEEKKRLPKAKKTKTHHCIGFEIYRWPETDTFLGGLEEWMENCRGILTSFKGEVQY